MMRRTVYFYCSISSRYPYLASTETKALEGKTWKTPSGELAYLLYPCVSNVRLGYCHGYWQTVRNLAPFFGLMRTRCCVV